jgi:cobalt/nickel transport system permease protein
VSAPDLTGVAGNPGSRVHRLDPRAKVVGLLAVTVVAVSTPLAIWPVFAACAAVLAAVAATARVPAAVVWHRGRLVLAPVLLVAVCVPLVRTGGAAHALGPLDVHDAGLEIAATVAAKALIGVTAAVLLGAVTAFPALLGGLEALRMPRVLVLIAGMMYRYLFVILGEAERTRAALAARAYRPRNAVHAGALGRVAGTLFLRSYGRGERVHLAMLARGYDGHMPRAAPLALGRADAVFVALVLLALVPLRLLAGAGP